jgi:hypothetical protein
VKIIGAVNLAAGGAWLYGSSPDGSTNGYIWQRAFRFPANQPGRARLDGPLWTRKFDPKMSPLGCEPNPRERPAVSQRRDIRLGLSWRKP